MPSWLPLLVNIYLIFRELIRSVLPTVYRRWKEINFGGFQTPELQLYQNSHYKTPANQYNQSTPSMYLSLWSQIRTL